ncbi:MAG: hypothetical protein AABY08_05470 [Candidatus Thermoplasmatota archaeon]
MALITAAGHLTLSVVNLIPGETTAGPAFAGMGIGYVVVAVLILRRAALLVELATLYTGGLIAAYAVSRLPIGGALPVEPIGLLIKADEVALLLVLVHLIRSGRAGPATAAET